MRKSTMLSHSQLLSVLLLISSQVIHQIFAANPESYVGAVVEYYPVTKGADGKELANANAENYRVFIEKAHKHNVDIIVFPEFGLTSMPKEGDFEKRFNGSEYRAYYRDVASLMPDPKDNAIICDSTDKYAKSLASISCAARDYRMYVVANHLERVDCDPQKPDCAPDGFLLYNSNVVFNREGQVVARYRKFNLFGEAGTNITSKPHLSIFTTDFGVTFGQFICFDLINAQPATTYLQNPNVTDIVYPTHWYDRTPFTEAIEFQSAWAYAADKNLLAACYSDDLTASGGSGIYAGRNGAIATYNPRVTSNALMVAEIPIRKPGEPIKNVSTKEPIVEVLTSAELKVPTISDIPPEAKPFTGSLSLMEWTSQSLNVEESSSFIETVCHDKVCCEFHVKTSYDKGIAAKPGAQHYRYRAVVNGSMKFGEGGTIVETCALVSCVGDSLDDCGKRYPNGTDVVLPTTIQSLVITRRADLSVPTVIFPVTSELTNVRPLKGFDDFNLLTSGLPNSTLVYMYLAKPRRDLETFGMFGMNFGLKGQQAAEAESSD